MSSAHKANARVNVRTCVRKFRAYTDGGRALAPWRDSRAAAIKDLRTKLKLADEQGTVVQKCGGDLARYRYACAFMRNRQLDCGSVRWTGALKITSGLNGLRKRR